MQEANLWALTQANGDAAQVATLGRYMTEVAPAYGVTTQAFLDNHRTNSPDDAQVQLDAFVSSPDLPDFGPDDSGQAAARACMFDNHASGYTAGLTYEDIQATNLWALEASTQHPEAYGKFLATIQDADARKMVSDFVAQQAGRTITDSAVQRAANIHPAPIVGKNGNLIPGGRDTVSSTWSAQASAQSKPSMKDATIGLAENLAGVVGVPGLGTVGAAVARGVTLAARSVAGAASTAALAASRAVSGAGGAAARASGAESRQTVPGSVAPPATESLGGSHLDGAPDASVLPKAKNADIRTAAGDAAQDASPEAGAVAPSSSRQGTRVDDDEVQTIDLDDSAYSTEGVTSRDTFGGLRGGTGAGSGTGAVGGQSTLVKRWNLHGQPLGRLAEDPQVGSWGGRDAIADMVDVSPRNRIRMKESLCKHAGVVGNASLPGRPGSFLAKVATNDPAEQIRLAREAVSQIINDPRATVELRSNPRKLRDGSPNPSFVAYGSYEVRVRLPDSHGVLGRGPGIRYGSAVPGTGFGKPSFVGFLEKDD